MKSIQTKLVLLILGCVVLSSMVIGGAGMLSAKRVVDEDSTQIMNLKSVDKAQEINAFLSRIEQSVKTLTVFATEELESAERLLADTDYMESYSNLIEKVAANAANNTQGALAVYLRFNPDMFAPTSGFFWGKTAMEGSFKERMPTDFSLYSPKDIKHVGWYYIPMRSGEPTWMLPYFNENIGVEMISYVIPVYKNSVAVGVVGMDIDFGVLKKLIDDTSIYKNGYAFLMDEQANIMYQKEVAAYTTLESLDKSLVSVSKELKAGGSDENLYTYSFQGKSYKMVFCNLQNEMRVAIAAPLGEIDKEKMQLIWQIIIAFVLIAAFALVLTIMMARRLTKPLRELNEAAQKIAAGDLSIELSWHGQDEVGMLAKSFQQTVNHLQTYIDCMNSLAYRDGLTGVKNKAAYQEATAKLEEETRIGRPRFGVVVFDINNLKQVNDNHGHDFGDMMIMDACKIICKVFKRSPVYRIGGDEFAVILERADLELHKELSGQLEQEIVEFNQYPHNGLQLSIARGIAIYEEGLDLSYGDVFKRADEAMYQNKAFTKQKTKREKIDT